MAAKASTECSLACELCEGTDVEVLSLQCRDRRYLRTVICRRCGLVYSDPRPGPEEVRDYYEHAYRLDTKGIYQPKPTLVYRAGKVATARFRLLSDVLTPGCRVLDVGAADGEFVYVARAMGCLACGFEPNEGYARFAADILGVPVQQGFYQDVALDPQSQDVVTMFHVLDHLETPRHALSHVGQWLRLGGRLVVEVPNFESVCQWPRTKYQRAHFYNFGPATLEELGRKAGYAVVRRSVTSDGGNVTVIFEKVAAPPAVSGQLPGHFEHLRAIVRSHTVGHHLLSPFPYARPMRKLAARVQEWLATRGDRSVKEALDQLIARELDADRYRS